MKEHGQSVLKRLYRPPRDSVKNRIRLRRPCSRGRLKEQTIAFVASMSGIKKSHSRILRF